MRAGRASGDDGRSGGAVGDVSAGEEWFRVEGVDAVYLLLTAASEGVDGCGEGKGSGEAVEGNGWEMVGRRCGCCCFLLESVGRLGNRGIVEGPTD